MISKEKVPLAEEGNFMLEEIASIPSFYFAQLNHAKDKLAFYWDKSGRHELYIMDLQTQAIEQISDGQLPRALRAGYIWSRDDKSIIFTRDHKGDEKHNLFEIDLSSGQVSQLTDTPDHQEFIIDSSPDGEWYTVVTNRHGQNNLYRMKKDDSDTFEQLTGHENPVSGGNYSPDGEWIVYGCNEEADLRNNDIYLIKPDGSINKRVVQVSLGSQDNFAGWSSDSRSFAFTTDSNGMNQAAIYNLDTDEITYFGDNSNEEYAGKITEDGKYLVGSTQKHGSVFPLIYEIKTGDKVEVDFPPGVTTGTQIRDSRYIYLTVNTTTSQSTLVRYDIETRSTKTLLDTDYGDVNPNLFVEGEHIFYDSLDGTSIPAIIYKPRDWDPDKLYPAILNPHGGPTANYFMTFNITAQYLVDRGFVVMLPNVRGSTGYGTEFRDACLKAWGTLDHEDWVAGRKWMIDHLSVDPERVVVFGGSYGGYATLVCLTKSPDLWAAGCSWIPVSHLKNMYELSNDMFKWFLRMQMGDPAENAELWEESSPLNYVENITAPLLLVHGEHDPRCPVEESRNVVKRLKELGREEGPNGDFEYIEFSDEGHGSSTDIKGRIRTIKLIEDFLYRRLQEDSD